MTIATVSPEFFVFSAFFIVGAFLVGVRVGQDIWHHDSTLKAEWAADKETTGTEANPADLKQERELYELLREVRDLIGMSWSDGEDPDDTAGRVDAALARYERQLGS